MTVVRVQSTILTPSPLRPPVQKQPQTQLSLSAQEQQLQQLQLLQAQLMQQTRLLHDPPQAAVAPSQPIIDNNLLAQIQALTNTLLSKEEPVKQQPAQFDKVRL